MRIPLSWLGEFVELPAGTTPEDVHADLVRVGFEEESIRRFDVSGPVVVGQVLSIEAEPQSNGKTINWCQVRVAPEGQRAADGGEDVRGIVCGAHNFVVGDKVVVTLPGAVLPGDFKIAARKTYGHVSDGMIASARELSLGDEHDGIIVLSTYGLDPEIGENALALLGLDETAVEINVTPDRGYAFSVRGVAREYSHATGRDFSDPAATVTPVDATGFPVTIADDAPIRGNVGCSGFVTRVVRGVDATRPTPPWMVARLQLAGIRSLSLPVDISNYVMLELGNPLHAYDLAKLEGGIDGGITVRRAQSGEKFTTLDGQERILHPEDLLITDGTSVLGLAGVMGGESTKTDDSTTDVLVEAATFDPISIARSARRHKLGSEASRRFERGVDPLVAQAAAQRMVDLLIELAGGTVDALGTTIVAPWTPATVTLPIARVNGLMGTDYSDDEVRGALRTIGCEVTDVDPETLSVTAPSWRSDLTRVPDLIEEVGRIVGYDRIPSVLPVAPAGRGLSRLQRLRRRAANMVTAAGFDEVQSYPFVSRQQLNDFGAGAEAPGGATEPVHAVKLANALDSEVSFMRRSLLPGLVTAAQRNVSRGLTTLSLTEFGSIYEPLADPKALGTETVPPLAELPSAATLAELDASLPAQPRRVAGLLVGHAVAKQPGEPERQYDWADALDAARIAAGAVSCELVVRQGAHRAFHPGRTADLFVQTAEGLELVGVAGELLPELSASYHLPGRVSAFELNLDRLIEVAPREPRTSNLSGYPAATQDLTLVVPADVPAADVLNVVVTGAGELLEEAHTVDDYRGQGVEEGQKALTFALRFRAADRTLKAEEASEAKLAGVAAAEREFGAKLRD